MLFVFNKYKPIMQKKPLSTQTDKKDKSNRE